MCTPSTRITSGVRGLEPRGALPPLVFVDNGRRFGAVSRRRRFCVSHVDTLEITVVAAFHFYPDASARRADRFRSHRILPAAVPAGHVARFSPNNHVCVCGRGSRREDFEVEAQTIVGEVGQCADFYRDPADAGGSVLLCGGKCSLQETADKGNFVHRFMMTRCRGCPPLHRSFWLDAQVRLRLGYHARQ